jgi:hypothetical protein
MDANGLNAPQPPRAKDPARGLATVVRLLVLVGAQPAKLAWMRRGLYQPSIQRTRSSSASSLVR